MTVEPIEGQVVPTPAEWVAEPHHEEPAAPVEELFVVEPTPEVVVEPTPAAVEEVAKSKNEEPAAAPAPAPAYDLDEKVVHTSALVFKSNSRNSVSVGLVQERLVEMGFVAASSDRHGWLCEGTMEALAAFANTSVEEVNLKDALMIEVLFAGTQVRVVS